MRIPLKNAMCLIAVFLALQLLATRDAFVFAQEVQVQIRGDVTHLQKIVSAYDDLKVRMATYKLSGSWEYESYSSPFQILSDCTIAHYDQRYLVEMALTVKGEDGVRKANHYQAKDFAESVNLRKGIITIIRRPANYRSLLPWQSLSGAIRATPDVDVLRVGLSGEEFSAYFIPERMRGTSRVLNIETDSEGNITVIREFSTYKMIFYAPAEFGNLISKVDYEGFPANEKSAALRIRTGWQSLPDVGWIPMEQEYTMISRKGDDKAWRWKITEYSAHATESDVEQPSLHAPAGWKIVDDATKEFIVVQGQDSAKIRGMLDSVDGTPINEP